MKKETIEEAAHEYFKRGQLGFEKASDTERAFINGAKWQQERSYSEEDMRTAWNSSEQNMRFNFSSSLYKNITFEQWIEQFKKK